MSWSKLRSVSVGVFVFVVMSAFLTGIYMPEVAAAEFPRMVPENFSQLAEVAKPAVVNIRTEKTVQGGGKVFRHFFGNPFGGRERDPFKDFFGPFEEGPSKEFKQRSLGSGFIID
ncbi:MAG: peptidase, partial [Desulfobacterales bacterium]